MITIDDANKIFKEYVIIQSSKTLYDFVPLFDYTITFEYGWVFFYQNKKFLETKNVLDKSVGNSPVIIDKNDGSINITGSANPVEKYIDEYVKRMSKGNK